MADDRDLGLVFMVTGESTIDGVTPGGLLVLDDPELATQLTRAGAVRALAHDAAESLSMDTLHRAGVDDDGADIPADVPELELMDKGDEMILLEFARAGIPFAEIKAKRKRGK